MGVDAIWIYFSRFFIFLLYLALALRARANKSENKKTRKINLILHPHPCDNIHLSHGCRLLHSKSIVLENHL